jgi:U4/U6 small nuclear ribonucleoprotein SNU13
MSSTDSPQTEIPEGAFPLADEALEQSLLDLLQMATHRRQIKKGANEVTKAVNRNVAEIVILTADTEPLAILSHLPLLCEEKNTAYCYVRSKVQVGRAVGVSRKVIAAAITANDGSDLQGKITEMKDQIEKLVL